MLLRDPRFQAPSNAVKAALLDALAVKGNFGPQTFDAVRTEVPAPRLTPENVAELAPLLTLVEIKTTKKPIKDVRLNNFFFGATQREYDLAAALGARYQFAFVVLNSTNEYGHPFYVLMSLENLEIRTRSKRIQYQVNLRSDIEVRELGEHAAMYPLAMPDESDEE